MDEQSGAQRYAYLSLGWLFFALGVIGLLLPVVPTSPFMLLSAWAFSKSSKRFEAWLVHHPWFGPSIVRFRKHRVIPLKAKLFSWGAMSVTFIVSVLSGKIPWWGLLGQALLMGYGAWFVSRFPSVVKDEVPSEASRDGYGERASGERASTERASGERASTERASTEARKP